MAFLELNNISKTYGKDIVLNNVSLTVEESETLVLFGPSGAGKTVLLRVVSGLVEAEAGSVSIAGQDMHGVEAEHRGIGMAFQNFALFPHMSAFENIASPLQAHRQSASAIKAGVDKMAKMLKIDHVLGHAPKELSNGQKQRTALARALAGSPPLLLLDDPLRNVDAKLRFEMRLELPRLLADNESTVVYVTQDYKEAMALGDRIAVLADGKVVQVGTPAEIYLSPATLSIARLFGDPVINAFDVIGKRDERGVYVSLSGVRVRLTEAQSAGVETEAVLGLRPESVVFCNPDDPDAIPISIEAETPLNEKTVTLALTEGKREILISRPSGTSAPDSGKAYVKINADRAMLFDRHTGSRIDAGAL
jgi:multiple sugar transport system ATP-binding protein